METTRQRPGSEESTNKRQAARRWFTVVGPPAATFSQQQISYGLVDWACGRGSAAVVFVPVLVALVVVAFAAMLSWRAVRSARDESRAEDTATGSEYFFGALGLLMSGIAAVIIVAQWLPTMFLHPCQR